MIDKIASKVERLRGMKAREIGHRVRERLRIEADRARYYTGFGVDRDAGLRELLECYHPSIKSYLETRALRRFYPSASRQRREDLAGAVRRHFPHWIERAVEEAGRLADHRMNVLGSEMVHCGAQIDWRRDPVTPYVWPEQFRANYRLAGSLGADPKIIHELNRHQHLPRLAKAFFLTGEERYAEEAVAQMEGWIRQNPTWRGVNWQSSLEIALRALSWIWTIFLLLPSRSFDDNAARRILKSLFRQLDAVYRYPSVYSSPNTHLIGEAAALFTAGLLFPELRRAVRWRKFGALTLVDEIQKQVSAEGVYREASTYYHCYATDFYLQTMSLGRFNRFAFPEWMWNRLSRMLEFVRHLTRPDGSIPRMGDDDGGRALALHGEDYSSFRDGLSSGAVLFGRGDFKHAAAEFAEETMWLLGHEAFDVFDSIAAEPGSAPGRLYPESGYLIQRSGDDAGASHLVLKFGGLGMDTGGHGHADALSFTLFGAGREALIDPGAGVYNGSPQWRDFFRSTRAHNAVVVDGADQSEPAGTFSWKRRANVRLNAYHTLAGLEFLDAAHDGYMRPGIGVTHRRRLLFARPDYWIVLDELVGRRAHDFDFVFQFAPGTELFALGDERRGRVECAAGAGESRLPFRMFMHAAGPLEAAVACGQTDPIQGWASRRYGERAPSPALSARIRSRESAAMMTFLVPRGVSPRSERLDVRGGNALAATLVDGNIDDICVFEPQGRETRLDDIVMRGELFWIRSKDGVLRQIAAVNARALSLGEETLFESGDPVAYAVVHLWEGAAVIELGGHQGKVYVRDCRYRQFQRR